MSLPNENLESGSRQLVPCYPCVSTPGGTTRVVGDPTIFEMAASGGFLPYQPSVTPVLGLPVVASTSRSSAERPQRRSRRCLKLTDSEIFDALCDSGSDGEEGEGSTSKDRGEDEEEEEEEVVVRDVGVQEVRVQELFDNSFAARDISRKLRTDVILDSEIDEERMIVESVNDEDNESMYERGPSTITACPSILAVNKDFSWSEDLSTFSGQKKEYLRQPGPNFASQEPCDIFQEIWDKEFMEAVVKETNLYAWQNIAQRSDPDNGIGIPTYMESWTEVTVGEMYRYFAMLIMMTFCHRSAIREYWTTDTLEMSKFRAIMSRNRFFLITKFIHFVPNINLLTRGNDRKIEKIAPVVDHCNRKFAAMYTPSQFLSLDESLLLWKGCLSWKQCIRSKAARFGIKSFELCESQTGYLLQFRLYTDKRVEMHPGTLHGFQNHTVKVVLDLIEKYLDVGHVLVMDNWYNQLPLTRYLKTTRNTDVLGTINRRRQGIPPAIKHLIPKQVKRGTTVTRHSGDIALVAWKDVKLVTVMSSYHQHLMVPGRRAGQSVLKPLAVMDYNRHMGGVDLKDQKLSTYLMERKRCLKWYLKVFRRLINCSILNAFLIYSKNPMFRVYTHRQFRFKLAQGLLSRYPAESPGPSRALNTSSLLRLQPGDHYPIVTEVGSGNRRKRLRCIRCYQRKKRVEVSTLCEACQVPLCLGKCFKEYHKMVRLN